jgi:hypothetical protein
MFMVCCCLAEVVALLSRPEEFTPARANGNGHGADSPAAPDSADVQLGPQLLELNVAWPPLHDQIFSPGPSGSAAIR